MHKLTQPTARIITGSLKGKALVLPSDVAVRPTRERVRQAVFNMLGSRLDWQGLAVADVCCGSGAWGLEALSRGASAVWLVDANTKPVAANVRALGLAANPAVQVVEANARVWVPPIPVDVILTDPPYESDVLKGVLANAAKLGKAGSWWAMETSATNPPALPSGFELIATRTHGGSLLTLARLRG